MLLFDPINIRYTNGSRNMQVWTMHNFCRYALVATDGPSIMFEPETGKHLLDGLETIDETRPACSHGIVGIIFGVLGILNVPFGLHVINVSGADFANQAEKVGAVMGAYGGLVGLLFPVLGLTFLNRKHVKASLARKPRADPT